MNRPKRIDILDIPVDLVDMDGAIAFLELYIQSQEIPGYVLAVNPEKIMALRKEPLLLDFFKKATLLIPDGIGVVWAAKLLGKSKNISRVPGADLMQALCSLAVKKKYRIYLYGSKEEVNVGATEILQERFPGLQIAGRSNGFVPKDKIQELLNDINNSGVDILFVALGSPKQEEWIAENQKYLNVKFIQGIGGTLDTITGHVKRAPEFMQRVHLEWFYRLLINPRRLKRQLVLPVFVIRVLVSSFGFNKDKKSAQSHD